MVSFLLLRYCRRGDSLWNDSSVLICVLCVSDILKSQVKHCIILMSHHNWVKYCIILSHHFGPGIRHKMSHLWIWPNLFSWLIGSIGGATTFACKSQGCLWQDWYIYQYIFSCWFQAWTTLIKQTEEIQKLIQQSAERLSTKTLDNLISLIQDKKTARKNYADERQRLEVEFAKVSGAVTSVVSWLSYKTKSCS